MKLAQFFKIVHGLCYFPEDILVTQVLNLTINDPWLMHTVLGVLNILRMPRTQPICGRGTPVV